MKLPPGFPVKVDIPVLPTVSARVTFHDFEWRNEGNVLPDSSFNIPEGYVEDPSRFPDLWHVDEVGLLNLEDRVPWVPQHKTRSISWRNSVKSQHQQDITRALVDQDFDFAFENNLDYMIQDSCVGGPTFSSNSSSVVNKSRPHSSNTTSVKNYVKPNEAEDLSSPSQRSSLLCYNNSGANLSPSSVSGSAKSNINNQSTPSVDFPFQFNFGSIYSSSLTIYFDN